MMRRRTGLTLLLVCVPLTIIYLLSRFRPQISETLLRTSKVDRTRKTIVVASTTKAHTDWVHEELPDWNSAIYVADNESAPLHPKYNVGREANIYLTYIIENYDDLPDIMVFIHGHRTSYHVDKAFNGNADSIRRLNLDHVRRTGYQNLNCWQQEDCVITKDSWWNYADPLLKEAWHVTFGYDMPDIVTGPLYAQFAVSRDQVLDRPKGFYERVHHWLLTTEQDDQMTGRALEHTWHIIFGKPPKYCVVRAECLCNAFGFCDQNDQAVQDAISATRDWRIDGAPKGYEEWKIEREKQGLDSGLLRFMVENTQA